MRKTLLILGVVLIAGCSEPTVDASTDKAFEVSLKKVRQSLPADQRERFDEALATLAIGSIDFGAIMSGNAENIESDMKASVDGKTGQQIIAEADRRLAEREKKEREQALKEIAELEAKQAYAEKAHEQLGAFEVVRSRFYIRESEYSFGRDPVIELEVVNGTDQAVSRAFFRGTVASPGRSVPWIEEDFNYSIPGGLEPGEKAEWSLGPNRFSDWGAVETPADAILTVEVVKLEGADGEAFLDAEGLSDRERSRLETLREKYH